MVSAVRLPDTARATAWAATASAAAWFVMRELSAANRRFDDFVRELNRFNARHEGDQP